MPSTAIFSLPYCGNIEFFTAFLQSPHPTIDLGENYSKQSFRTRTYILGANGIQQLSVPVVKKSGIKQTMAEIAISYDSDWQRIHLTAIKSAYGSSPFFEYYYDDIADIIATKHHLLKDLSIALLDAILDILQIDKAYRLTSTYYQGEGKDYRNTIQPKNNNTFQHPSYTQVFSEKHNFLPNLSILDLLFNEGPNAEAILTARSE